MAVSVQRFVIAFPEFRETSEALVQAKIDAADRRTSETLWGDKRDDGVMLLTAHLLSVAPEGEQARLKKDNRATPYSIELERMRRVAAFGAGRVV